MVNVCAVLSVNNIFCPKFEYYFLYIQMNNLFLIFEEYLLSAGFALSLLSLTNTSSLSH